ncbi:MAG TPA: DUF4349 domain-containing protein [Longimicrobium sp.]|nr:DUF4349 domain-containing protein [Longimicrobium sp.]
MSARLLAVLALSMATTACAGGRAAPATLSRPAPEGAQWNRAVAQHATLRLVTDSLRRVQREADSLAVAWGGYVGDAEAREKELRMSLRVPADSLGHGLDRLSALGRATHRTVRRDDVTEQVVDAGARLETLRAVRERLRAYLQQAATMADLVALERELGRVQGEIDLLEARQRALATQVALAEIDLHAERPRVLGPLGWIFVGLGTLVEKLFVIR